MIPGKQITRIIVGNLKYVLPIGIVVATIILLLVVLGPVWVALILGATILATLVLFPGVAHAYTVRFGPLSPCHEIITGKAIDLLEKESKVHNFPHWEEIRVYRQKLMEGARDEDFLLDKTPGEPVQEDESVKLTHYYNPFTRKPVPSFPLDICFDSKDQAKIPVLKISAIDRALNHESKIMESYKLGDFEKIYWYLGRICHLVQDMTVPAHVHCDVHWQNMKDDFENKVDFFARSGRMLNFSISNHNLIKIYTYYQKKKYRDFNKLLPDFLHNTAFHTFTRSVYKIQNMGDTASELERKYRGFIMNTVTERRRKLSFLVDKKDKQLAVEKGEWVECADKPGYAYIRKVANVVPFYWKEINNTNLHLWELYYKYFVSWAINSTAALLMLWYETVPRLETSLEKTVSDETQQTCYQSFKLKNRGGIKEKIIIQLDGIPPYISATLRHKNRPLKKGLHNLSQFEVSLDPQEEVLIDLELIANPGFKDEPDM